MGGVPIRTPKFDFQLFIESAVIEHAGQPVGFGLALGLFKQVYVPNGGTNQMTKQLYNSDIIIGKVAAPNFFTEIQDPHNPAVANQGGNNAAAALIVPGKLTKGMADFWASK
jgi:hypothetical protein